MVKNTQNAVSYKILVLEDDFLIARDVTQSLRAAGMIVVGPFAEVGDARAALEDQEIDGAVLDVKLADETSFSIADTLLERGVPFIFGSGIRNDFYPDHLRTVPRIEKPFSTDQILEWVRQSFAPPPGSPVNRDEPLSNLLLSNCDAADLDRLRPHMLRVKLKRRWILLHRNRPMERVYFPETAVGSMLVGAGDRVVEVGMVGREGVIGFPIFENTQTVPVQFIAQADGDAIAVTSSELHAAIAASQNLATLFARHQYLLTMQISYTALAHAAYPVEQRLARWLLMYEDRVSARIVVVHEFLSLMLHVRRPSVTLAIQSLEAMGAISTERGEIFVRDREKLLTLAGPIYGVPEREQARLFPPR